MVSLKTKLPAILGIMIGFLSIMAGSKVLLGTSSPNYIVLDWLVIYNVSLGVVSVVAGAGLWRLRSWAISLASLIAVSHGFVLALLTAFFMSGKSVAYQSILAMLFRTTVWLGIFLFVRTPKGDSSI
jgi:lysylphosphatidylglycerol synthetase-like protein (DUF2156 family)